MKRFKQSETDELAEILKNDGVIKSSKSGSWFTTAMIGIGIVK